MSESWRSGILGSGWTLSGVLRYFARNATPLSVSVSRERADRELLRREITFTADSGFEAAATVVVPNSRTLVRGVVLAHGGSIDGRRAYLPEAGALAAAGAAVVLPATRMRLDRGVDTFAADVRNAVLTERAALDVLVQTGAPASSLSFLGHSAGGALAAILCAVEPRLSRIVVSGNGGGAVARATLARELSQGGPVDHDAAAVADWFDLNRFVNAERHAPLLLQHGRADQSVPLEAARALFDAAAAPKRWAEYDCDHALDADPAARRDRADFIDPPGR